MSENSKAEQQAQAVKMNERKQRATAIVAKILKVLDDEKLTIHDAHRILDATQKACVIPVHEMKRSTQITIPENLEERLEWSEWSLPNALPDLN